MSGYSISDLLDIDGRMLVDDGSTVLIDWAYSAPSMYPEVARDVIGFESTGIDGIQITDYASILPSSTTYVDDSVIVAYVPPIRPLVTIESLGDSSVEFLEELIDNNIDTFTQSNPPESLYDARILVGIAPMEGVLYRVKGNLSIGGLPPENPNDVSVFMTGRNNDDNSTRRLAVQDSGDFETTLQGILPSQKYAVYTLWGDVDDVEARGGLVRDSISPAAFVNGYINKLKASQDMPIVGDFISNELITIDFNNEPTIKTYNITGGNDILSLGKIWNLVESSTGYYIEPYEYICTNLLRSSLDNVVSPSNTVPSYISLTGGGVLEIKVPTGNISRLPANILHDSNNRDVSAMDIMVYRNGRFNIPDSSRYPIHHKAFEMDLLSEVGFGWDTDPSNTVIGIDGYGTYTAKGIQDASLEGGRGVLMSSSVDDTKYIYVDILWPFDYSPGLDLVMSWRTVNAGDNHGMYASIIQMDSDGGILHEETQFADNTGASGRYDIRYKKDSMSSYRSGYNKIDWSIHAPMRLNTSTIRVLLGTPNTYNDPLVVFQGVEFSVVKPTPKHRLRHAVKVT